MANQLQSPSIAILLDSKMNDSLIYMKKNLQSVSCLVDFVAMSTLNKVLCAEPIKLLNASSELQDYDLVIYQYGCCFFTLSSWLSDFDGKIMIQYDVDDIALSNLRAYHHATSLVHQVELERQYFSEWVQSNCLRVFWLASSPSAANHLKSWGVKDSIDNIAIIPPFLESQDGKYACEKQRNKMGSNSILVTGPYIPDTGHIMIVNIIKDYHKFISQSIHLRFIGKAYAELSVYLEEIKSHIKRLNLESYIHLEFSNEPVEVETLMNADIMLSMDNDHQCSPNERQAQAMGLPLLKLDHAKTPSIQAKSLEQALNDKSVREELILKGYQNISSNYFLSSIKQTFLTSVVSALRQ
ncbi:MAG: hypothetical protein ACKVJK_13450 [Methylophagaceae bacterium]